MLVTIAICGCLGASIEGELHAQVATPRPPVGPAGAVVSRPRIPTVPNLRVQLPGALRARLAAKIRTRTGEKTVQEVLSEIDGSQSVTLSNGKSMTIQDLTDRIGRAETSASARATSLSSATVPEESWANAQTLQRIQTQNAAFTQQVAALPRLARVAQACTSPPCPTTPIRDDGDNWNPPANAPQPIVPSGCRPQSGMCRPSRGGVEAAWSREKGDENFVYMDVAYSARGTLPTGGTADCATGFDAGIKLLGRERASLVHYTATENARVSMDNRDLGTGTAALTVGTKTVELNFGATRRGPSNITDSFTASAEMTVPIIPGIGVKVSASGGLGFGASLDGQHLHESATVGARCRERLEPNAKVTVGASGSLVLGIGDLVELAEAGVEAELVPIEVTLPTTVEGYVGQNPILARLAFRSSLTTTYMKGTLRAFYRIADICWDNWLDDGRTCFVRDILGIRTRGTKKLWEHDGFKESSTLADVNRVLPWVSIAPVRR